MSDLPHGTAEVQRGRGASGGPPDDDGSPVTIGVMFVPQTIHQAVNNPSGNSTDPPAIQVQGQYTFKFHRDGQDGFEFSPVAQAQFMYDPDKKQLITPADARWAGCNGAVPD